MDNRDYGRHRLNNDNLSDSNDIDNDNDSQIEEAEEDREVYIDDDHRNQESDDEDAENLDDNYSKDYQELPGLDKYESEGMDEEDYSQISDDARRRAEREMDIRERGQIAHDRRIPQAM